MIKMALTKEQKKELLVDSFNVLKNDLYGNRYSFIELIGKMAKYDLGTAIELWKYVIENGTELVQSEGLSVIFSIAYALEKQIGDTKINTIIFKNPVIKEAVLSQSNDLTYAVHIIVAYIRKGDLEEANACLNKVYENSYKEDSFGNFLLSVTGRFDEDNEIGEDAAELVLFWAKKIDEEEIKAKITISLLEFM